LAAIRIRYGLPSEREALEDLQRRASLVWQEYREALLAHPEAVRLPSSQLEKQRVRVAERDLAAVGFSVLLPRSAGISELDGLFVEPIHWRTGIGWALMHDAVGLAQLQKARAIEVTANPRAEGFYKKFGFVRIGEVQTQFGPASRMRYVLTVSRGR